MRIKKVAAMGLAVFIIVIMAVYGYFWFGCNSTWTYFTSEPLVGIDLYDSQSSVPVHSPLITSIKPDLTLIASPGTEADGAFIYELYFPIPAIIVAEAPGYETTRFMTVLRRGQVGKFILNKVPHHSS